MAKRRKPIRRPEVDPNKPRVNREIRALEIRLITPEGGHDITSVDRGIEIAESMGLDLVEISPNAKPPVCKVIDFGKFMYERKKKEKEAKKKQHTTSIKELRFRPRTDDHDFEFKSRHARTFLKNGDKVKCTVQFRGRDMLYTENGNKLLMKLAEELSDVSKIDAKPAMEGRRMIMMLTPK